MSTQPTVGRNEPCPCGSGKKYKFCCEGRHDVVEEARRSPWLVGGLAVVGIAVVATVAMQLGEAQPTPQPTSYGAMPPIGNTPVSAPMSPVPPPPGAAPAGKVWSPEHGHYHDAPGAGASAPLVTTSNPVAVDSSSISPSPVAAQPEGPAPEGKVWSAEHGHYHDAPTAGPQVQVGSGVPVPIPAPAGDAPAPVPPAQPEVKPVEAPAPPK